MTETETSGHNGEPVLDVHGHPHDRPFLEWGGLIVDMAVLRLFASFWISLIVAIGCIWIILAPTNTTTTNAAYAVLGSIVTGWITWMNRQ